MSRCKACNKELAGVNRTYFRLVELEDGSKVKIEEDLCRDCRSALFYMSDPDDFDLIDSLGWDADQT